MGTLDAVMDEDRPSLVCLVANPFRSGHVTDIHVVSLAEAERLHAERGWWVLLDPASEAALARWEQLQRSQRENKA